MAFAFPTTEALLRDFLQREQAGSTSKALLQSVINNNHALRLPSEFRRELLLNVGNPDMNVDGSVTPVMFEWVATEAVFITQFRGVIIHPNIQHTSFGGLSELETGVLFDAYSDNDTLEHAFFLDGIKSNWQLSLISTTETLKITGDDDDDDNQDILTFVVNFASSGYLMYLPKGWYVRTTIRDDLTGLDAFRMSAIGYTRITAIKA